MTMRIAALNDHRSVCTLAVNPSRLRRLPENDNQRRFLSKPGGHLGNVGLKSQRQHDAA
jgi:hypothetical protein